MPLGVPELRAEQRLRALRVRLLDRRRGSRAAAPSLRPRSPASSSGSSTIRARPLTRKVSFTPGIRNSSAIRSSSSRFVSVSASLFPGRSGSRSVRSSRMRTKPAGIAARRDVEPAAGAAGRDDDERRPLDELPRERVEPVGDLLPARARSARRADREARAPSTTRTSAAASRARRRRPRARPGRSCRGTRARATRRRSAPP